ncbi:MAG: type II toxin-antitoxin system prevent-host-death family antitoxin [Gemmatimonadota bacterium]
MLLSKCSLSGYIIGMRTVGIREMKNRLSEFLRIVAAGEVVLVTDHGRVVAQLGPPPAFAPPPLEEEDALRRLAAAGKIRLAAGRVPSPGSAAVEGVPRGIDTGALLDATRAERSDA